jgi:hypothetical protein
MKITPTQAGGQGVSASQPSPAPREKRPQGVTLGKTQAGQYSPLPGGSLRSATPSGAPRIGPDGSLASVREGARSPYGEAIAGILDRVREAEENEDADVRLMADANDPTLAAMVTLREAIDSQIATRMAELRAGLSAARERAFAGVAP